MSPNLVLLSRYNIIAQKYSQKRTQLADQGGMQVKECDFKHKITAIKVKMHCGTKGTDVEERYEEGRRHKKLKYERQKIN